MANRPAPEEKPGLRRLLVIVGVTIAAAACNLTSGSAGDAVKEVTLPRLADVTAATRQAIEARHVAATTAVRERRGNRETASAFGQLGMLLMAAEFHDAAAAAFENATLLSPDEARWHYYLAHAHRSRGDATAAAAAFERTLAVDPGQAAASWWLGSAYLDLGRARDAEASFGRARDTEGFLVPSLYGLGRAAFAEGRYEEAIGHFERALRVVPDATSVRYPLGLAYRKLGRLREAEAQLQYRSTSTIRPPDALLDALLGLVESPLAFHSQGVAAGLVGDWPKAVEHFRRAVALGPDVAPAHVNLAVALHRVGDHDAALAAARRAMALAPTEARAYSVAGAALTALGRDADALRVYTEGERADAGFVEIHFALAELLRKNGRLEEALERYATVLELTPASADAEFGSALALVRLGRNREARDRLDEGMRAHPDEPRFAHALARVLATAREAGVRDGARALDLIETLMAADATVDRATTMAMALAAAGRYADAVAWQQRAIAAVDVGSDGAAVAGMRRNLAAFERGQAAPEPWPADDPIHRPTPRAAPGMAE